MTEPDRRAACLYCGRRMSFRVSGSLWRHDQPIPPEEDHAPIPDSRTITRARKKGDRLAVTATGDHGRRERRDP